MITQVGTGMHVEGITIKDADHARNFAERHREEVDSHESIPAKLAYFQGVLDWMSMEESEQG